MMQDQPHPHYKVPPSANWDPSVPIDIVVGLQWREIEDWKGYYADGLLCGVAWGPGIPPEELSVSFETTTGFDWWANPGNPPQESHAPPHAGNTCKWFATWSNDPEKDPTRDATITVTIKRLVPGGEETLGVYTVRLRIIGGPLRILEKQRAERDEAFIMHRAMVPNGAGGFNDTVDASFPWYLTDFDYNPFHYRSSANYEPNGLQRVNVVEAKPLWTQPAGITVQYGVTGVGTFLNPDAELGESPPGVPNPRQTTFLDGSKTVKVAMDGDQDAEADVFLSAAYYVGVPSGQPPFSPYAVDDSNIFYAYMDVKDSTPWRQGHLYTYLRPHKPASLHDYRNRLLPYYPPPGAVGAAFIYQLQDSRQEGMPGVWIQERFCVEPPGWFATNNNDTKWITRRKGFTDAPDGQQIFGTPTDVDGVFNSWDDLFLDVTLAPRTITGHEYWAATNIAARKIADYPWRVIPGSNPPVKKWLGIFVGAFDIVFTTETAQHPPRERCSPENPPP